MHNLITIFTFYSRVEGNHKVLRSKESGLRPKPTRNHSRGASPCRPVARSGSSQLQRLGLQLGPPAGDPPANGRAKRLGAGPQLQEQARESARYLRAEAVEEQLPRRRFLHAGGPQPPPGPQVPNGRGRAGAYGEEQEECEFMVDGNF